jgi:hypothetical protein
MISTLVARLGGAQHLLAVKDRVSPKSFDIDVSMWIKDSTEQEGGFIEPETINTLSQLGAGLSFGFYARNAT